MTDTLTDVGVIVIACIQQMTAAAKIANSGCISGIPKLY
ncbi:hypothetical protein SAMN05421740_11465 [Parapedobacter koreensis]|uniref:Uncharacterized protein n=1 Tax=Parapedobacter koreensis TaxID=332977 RepID=A0A1H7UAI2_9SPHI|nr:hypothetical protein SAMN05421740_11465 [Parapedobacter koreensis]